MAQQNIDFGAFPDDPSADAIRSAFQKVQENFDEVFTGITNASVTSVNRSWRSIWILSISSSLK